jgi:hypothetical protein
MSQELDSQDSKPASLPDKSAVLKMLQAKNGEYHPLIELMNIGMDDKTDVRLKVDCHKTIAKYCEAELRSVEVKGAIDANLGVLRVSIDTDDGSPDLPTELEDL